MKKNSLLLVLTGIALMGFMLGSCEKNDDIDGPDTQLAEDDALADLMFDDLFAEVEDAMETMEYSLYGGEKKSSSVVCKQITVERPSDTTFWPRTVTIDYGEGCEGPNGNVRKGKVIVEVNHRYPHEDYYRTVTLEDFYIKDDRIEGTRSVVNEGKNENDNIYFTLTLSGGKITKPDGQVISRDYERIREWISGAATPRFRLDDEYLVTGSSTGVNRNGVEYTRSITVPLEISLSCRWIRAGVVDIVNSEGNEIQIDYGDGTCDRTAVVTVNGESKTIILRR
jgi:hypothetical protein